jgi:hypothetical protein
MLESYGGNAVWMYQLYSDVYCKGVTYGGTYQQVSMTADIYYI